MKSPSPMNNTSKQNVDPLIGKTFLKKYLLTKKLGEGSFGMIYLGEYNDERYALKFENKREEDNLLETESHLLNYLKGPNIPYIKSFGSCTDYNILVMELLGKSLEDLMISFPLKKFSLRTICNIGIQMITVINYIHDKHFIHRDIKPDNFVIGLKEKMNQIYLIDFGLAKKYRSNSTLMHYPMKTKKKLTGTARYASINALRGIDQSRRDDLESIGYVLIYLFKGVLPWQGLIIKNKEDRYDKIREKKQEISPNELCTGMPRQFAQFIGYTRGLEYEQNPDYELLKRLLLEALKQSGHDYDLYCDWVKSSDHAKSTTQLIIKDQKEQIYQRLTQPIIEEHNQNQCPNGKNDAIPPHLIDVINNNNKEKEDGNTNNNNINSTKQFTVENKFVNQINNIVIINANGNPNANTNPNGIHNNNGREDNDDQNDNQLKNQLIIPGLEPAYRQVPSNQAMHSSINEPVNLAKSFKSNKEITPKGLKEIDINNKETPQVSPPLFVKNISTKHNPCTMCCIM